jgi:hypothetical protein
MIFVGGELELVVMGGFGSEGGEGLRLYTAHLAGDRAIPILDCMTVILPDHLRVVPRRAAIQRRRQRLIGRKPRRRVVHHRRTESVGVGEGGIGQLIPGVGGRALEVVAESEGVPREGGGAG